MSYKLPKKLKDTFVDAFMKCQEFFNEIDCKNQMTRINNNNAWEKVEKRLSKIQGDYRSSGWNEFKCISMSFIPIGSDFFDEIVSRMTEEEKKILDV